MSKGLEALKYLDEHNLNWHDNPTKRYVTIVEQELKDLNTIKEIFDDYDIEFKLTTLREAVFLLKQLQGEKSQCWDNALKKLKALEIIKKKSVDLLSLHHAFTMDKEGEQSGFEWFNNRTLVKRGVYDTLTQEEYNLLKEVLL